MSEVGYNFISDFYKSLLDRFPLKQVVCDLIAGMTDTYAVAEFQRLFIPAKWKNH